MMYPLLVKDKFYQLVSRQAKKIYHVSTGKYYGQTIPEVCFFCTEQDAIEAGFKMHGEMLSIKLSFN